MIAVIIHWTFTLYMLMIMARLISSWFPGSQRSRFVQFLGFYTEPYLGLFRKVIPPIGVLDLSPMIALILLQLAEKLVFMLL
jgi:YggT family protein